MFKKSVNIKAIHSAKEQVEATLNGFDRKVFNLGRGEVSFCMRGDFIITEIDPKSPLSPDVFMGLYKEGVDEIRYEKSKLLVQIRNSILKKHKFDIRHTMSEIQEAIDLLNSRQDSAKEKVAS